MLEGNLVRLKEPTLDDWHRVRAIWEDPETMHDVGGPVCLSYEKYLDWHRYMFKDHVDENCYFLILTGNRMDCIGEISFHRFNKLTGEAMFNIKIKKDKRRHGFGREAMDLILRHFFEVWAGRRMLDSLRSENGNGVAVLCRYGFKILQSTENEIELGLERSDWEKLSS